VRGENQPTTEGGQPEPGQAAPAVKRRLGRAARGAVLAASLIAAGIFAFLLWHEFARKRLPPQASRLMIPGGVPVTTAVARKGSIGVYLEAIGTVTPVYTASITAQVNGLITGVHYTEGQIVHKGDPLIDIDSRPFEAQVQQARGTLERDTSVLAQARMDLERYRDAWARNAIPRQQFEDQEKLVAQDEGQVKSDQGNLAFYEVQLGWCRITAPFPGRVGLRLVDPGNVVVLSASNQINGTTSLVVVTQTEPITVVFTLAEDDLSELRSQLRLGRTLPVYAYDRTLQTRLASGKLTALDNQVDTTTGTVKLRAEFDNTDERLFPNQFVNTRLLLKTLTGVTLVPSQAIQHNGQMTFVYWIEGGEARIRNVKTGAADRGMTVVEGIRSGTVVATSSFEKLRDNTPVERVKDRRRLETSGSDLP
jgi:membrane fusion protein, multidrug efflux system